MRPSESNMADPIDDHQSSIVSFYGLCLKCEPFIHSTGADSEAGVSHQIFSISKDSPPCGVLFGTFIPEHTITSQSGGAHVLVAIGSDENRFAELDLATHCRLRFLHNSRRIYSRRFLFILILRCRSDGYSERVGAGKVDAAVFLSTARSIVRKVHLMDEVKSGTTKRILGWCRECSRAKPNCIFLS